MNDLSLFLLGYVVGILIGNILIYIRHKVVGTLKIDHSNPEKDTYRFELNDFDSLNDQKMVFLKIDNNADLSQK